MDKKREEFVADVAKRLFIKRTAQVWGVEDMTHDRLRAFACYESAKTLWEVHSQFFGGSDGSKS